MGKGGDTFLSIMAFIDAERSTRKKKRLLMESLRKMEYQYLNELLGKDAHVT